MLDKKDASIFSLYAYAATNDNSPWFSPWTRLENRILGTDGFSYSVFQDGAGKIVIAYRGTDGFWSGDMLTNMGAIVSQERQAALVAAQYISLYGASNVSFTGHSLGGGLAATMAVWFNCEAVVFDPAPTQGVATSYAIVTSIINSIPNPVPLSLLAYAADVNSEFVWRESNVTSYYAPGSGVNAITTAGNTITGQSIPIAFGIDTFSPFDMHSQALLTAGLLSTSFVEATVAVQRVLPIMFRKDFYNLSPTGDAKNVFIDLIRSEQTNTGNGKLTHLANDLQKLGTNLAGLNVAAQDAIIAQGIEWYYWQENNYTGQEFFTKTGALFQYTTAIGAGLDQAQNKAVSFLKLWLEPITNQHGAYRIATNYKYEQWNINASSTGATASSVTNSKTQIFIGHVGNDNFTTKHGVRSCFLPLNSAIQQEVSSNKTHIYYNFNSTLGNKYDDYSKKLIQNRGFDVF